MVNLPLPAAADTNNNVNNDNNSSSSCCKCRPFKRIKWTTDYIVQFASNILILSGTFVALSFAIYAVRDVKSEYVILTVFIVGGTLFGGGCLLALVNVSWLSRRPGRRLSAIQVICNVVLFLIASYLELLFWPYPTIAYAILFGAILPMFILVNLPSCFEKKVPIAGEGETVCLEQDACDDMTIEPLDETQQTDEDETGYSKIEIRDLEASALFTMEELTLVQFPVADDHEVESRDATRIPPERMEEVEV